tara:strand:+ start:734 stop:1081 length:348 start_codon:yes stop_codon:yes gene_type:complete
MIVEGKHGSFNIFFNDVLIHGYPLGRMNVVDYFKVADNLMIKAMRENNRTLRQQSLAYKYYCTMIYMKKLKKKDISEGDLRMFLACMLALVKLKQFEPEEVLLIMPRKKIKTDLP